MNTCFVLICDNNYFHKLQVTIKDLKIFGKWSGDTVVITIDFDLTDEFKNNYSIIEKKFPLIDKSILLNKIGQGFSNSDGRELGKLNQWEKLHVFDDYFLQWDRIVFLDAGLRVLDDVKYLLELDCSNSILAPNDVPEYLNKDQRFNSQVSYDNPDMIELIKKDFGDILNETYMLNCMWMYDTNILHICNKQQLIDAMNTYTLCKTNEMTVMNLLFHFKYHLWKEFPYKSSHGKFLFEWSELNHTFYTNWRDYCFMKYSISIRLADIEQP